MNRNELIKISHGQISFSRRILKTNYSLFILNAGLSLWNIINIYYHQDNLSWIPAIATGFGTCCCAWIWLNIWETRLDIKIEKQKLSYLEKEYDH
jgi:hypothetical protein